MSRAAGTVVALLLAAAAQPAGAQQAAVLGLFNQRCEAPEDDPDAPPPPEAAAAPNAAPIPFAPPPKPAAVAPVHVEDADKTPDGPPSVDSLAYDSRVRSSFASAEAFQGPLDGGWTLAADGQDLYAFQLADKGHGVEGAWRDLHRKGALDGSGLVDAIERDGGRLTLRFAPQPGQVATATLQAGAGGVWSGQLVQGGQGRAVTLRRTAP